jgi:hypothetical protein
VIAYDVWVHFRKHLCHNLRFRSVDIFSCHEEIIAKVAFENVLVADDSKFTYGWQNKVFEGL